MKERKKNPRNNPLKVGDVLKSKEGYDLTVIEYVDSLNVTVSLTDGTTIHTNTRALRNGSVRNPNHVEPVVEKVSKLKKTLTYPVDVLREILDYDPNTGDLIWKKRKLTSPHWTKKTAEFHNKRKAGHVAGRIKKVSKRDYYRKEIILPDGREYLQHRVIWAWMTGAWPESLIDHIDQDPLNNRWDNLQEADYHDNQQNVRLRSDNAVGYVGVYWTASQQRWVAQTTYKGEKLHEYCDTLLDAVATRIRQQKQFGFSDNHGKRK